jgi:hypothetical protein
MSIQHSVFLQRQEPGPKGKVILVSVVDAESVGMAESDSQAFVMATTTTSPYTRMNPTITLEITSKMSAKEYVVGARKSTGDENIEHTKGMGISGILHGPYWFIRKFRTVIEQMGG